MNLHDDFFMYTQSHVFLENLNEKNSLEEVMNERING